MKKSFRRGLMACLSLVALASCQDYEGGFDLDQIKKGAYAKHFEETFGKPDPNQDWSMATLIKANVNLPGLSGTAKMNICTGDPRNADTRLLAQIMLKDGQGSIDFDAIKGSDKVFVTVEQDGQYKVFGQYALKDGMLNVGNITPEMLLVAAPMTRAFSGTCPTTQSTDANGSVEYTYFNNTRSTTETDGIKYPSDASYENDQTVKSLEGWIAYAKGSGIVSWNQYSKTLTNNSPFTDESICSFNKVTPTDFSTAVLKDANFAEDNHDGTITMYWDSNGKSGNPNWKDAKSTSDWKQDAVNNYSKIVDGTYNGPWTNESLKSCFSLDPCSKDDDGAIFSLTDESTWQLKSNAAPRYIFVHPTFQYLKNVETSAAPAYNLATANSFFGEGKFFAEGKSVWGGEKLGVFYDDDTMLKMEKGYSIVTTANQVIELPFVFGCTAYCNQFGYIYYKASDEDKIDPIALKHFVLIEDGRPAHNIYRGTWGGTPVASDDHGSINDGDYTYNLTDSKGNSFTGSLNGTTLTKNDDIVCSCNEQAHTGIYSDSKQHLSTCYSPAERYALVAKQEIVGTTYRPMFFGADGNTSLGTYEWPEGYKIVFWINTLSTSHETADVALLYSHTLDNSHGGEHFNYSLPAINKRLYHNYQGTLGSMHDDLDTFGQVQTISWTIDGTTFLAFGDVSTDKDLNDMVFMVSAPNSNTGSTVVVTPVRWHLNYNSVHEDNDLFETYSLNINASYTNPKKSNGENSEPTRPGYEFVGWSLSDPTASSGETNISATVPDENAINYYAIWKPVGEGVTIRWHYNYDGSHGVHEGASSDVYQSNSVAIGDGYTKPATNPAYRDATKVFKGWAESWNATTVLSESDLTGLTATEDKCYYAIWEPAPTPGTDPEPITWILACEDLGGSFDYDFNDVVWSVQTSWSAGVPTTKVKVLAAGGTLGFALKYDGTQICTKGNAFTETTTDDQVVNAAWSKGVNRTPSEFILNTAITNLSSNWRKFSVVVKDHGDSLHEVQNVQSSTTNSKAPQIILLPEAWEWPTELTPIDKAYTNFSTWVTDNTAATWDSWAEHKIDGKTVSRQ